MNHNIKPTKAAQAMSWSRAPSCVVGIRPLAELSAILKLSLGLRVSTSQLTDCSSLVQNYGKELNEV
jgi:hypothetical protein